VQRALVSRRPEWATATLWALTLILLAAFTAIAHDVYVHHALAFDRSMLTALHHAVTPALTAVAVALTDIGDPTVIAPATAVVIAALALARRWRWATLVALEVGGAAALDLATKTFFARPRPTLYPHLVHETGFSFPSGHATGDLAFFLALQLLAWHALPPRWRWLGVLGILLALACGISRPYLQIHYPSDILAGWALGAGWVLLMHLLFYRSD